MANEAIQHPFDELVSRPEAEVRLGTAALLFAVDEYPQLDTDTHIRQLDDLAERVADCPAYSPTQRVEALRHVLVNQEDFRGSAGVFSEPDAGYLNRVLETKRGLPVSLSVVWLDVARRLGWPMHGVGMPGHFIVAYDCGEDGPLLVDPLNAGALLSLADCREMLHTMFGEGLAQTDAHLERIAPPGILERMLGNLYALYVEQNDWLRASRVLARTVALRPGHCRFRAELGRVLTLAGKPQQARDVLDEAAMLAADEDEARLVQSHQAALRRALSARN